MRPYFRYILIFTLLFPALLSHAAKGPEVTISSDVNGSRIEVGQTFHITIEAKNCAGNIDMKSMPPGVKVVYHTSQSTSGTTVVNGKTDHVSSTALILTCKGQTPGDYTFGPVAVNGVKSNVLSYKIVPATPGSNSSAGGGGASGSGGSTSNPYGYDPNGGPVFVGNGNEEMFLKAHVNKSSAYEQEAIEYTVKLYSTYGDIKFLGAATAPKFDGFVMDESDDVSKSFSFEEYNGKQYATAVIARYIIFPQKSGKLTVKGNTYTVSTDARQYYDDPYYRRLVVKRPIQLNVTPNDVVIDVKALPQPIPENFIGGVGSFHVSSSMPSRSLTTNNPASLVYTVSGVGNIKYVKLPELSYRFPKSVEVFTPEIKTDVKVGSSNVSGKISFDYSVVPHETGSFTIPSLDLWYFDPSEGEYRKLETSAYEINVTQGKSSVNSQQTSRFNPELMPVGSLTQKIDSAYVKSPFYWLWYIIPVILFVLSFAFYSKYIHDHADLTALRSKQANKMALKRLSKAYQAFQKHDEEQFYDEMLAALWGYLADKLKMPTSELNRGNVSEEMKRHGVQESTFMPILNLIDECEYAKYTPVARDANMRQLYSDAVNSIANVESEYDKETGKKEDSDDYDDHADGDRSAESLASGYINTQTSDNTKSADETN